MGYFIFTIIIGIVGALVAGDKGRSRFWWGLSCFIVPPAILFPVFLSPVAAVRGRWQQCEDCAEIVKWDARVCKFCGTDLTKWWKEEDMEDVVEADVVEETEDARS